VRARGVRCGRRVQIHGTTVVIARSDRGRRIAALDPPRTIGGRCERVESYDIRIMPTRNLLDDIELRCRFRRSLTKLTFQNRRIPSRRSRSPMRRELRQGGGTAKRSGPIACHALKVLHARPEGHSSRRDRLRCMRSPDSLLDSLAAAELHGFDFCDWSTLRA